MRVDVMLVCSEETALLACARRADRDRMPLTLWIGDDAGGHRACSRAAVLLDATERITVGIRAQVSSTREDTAFRQASQRLAARHPGRLRCGVEIVSDSGKPQWHPPSKLDIGLPVQLFSWRPALRPYGDGQFDGVILLHAALSELPHAAREALGDEAQDNIQIPVGAVIPICYGPPLEALNAVRREFVDALRANTEFATQPTYRACIAELRKRPAPTEDELVEVIPDALLRDYAVTSDQALCDRVELARECGLASVALRAVTAGRSARRTPAQADLHATELAAQLTSVASAAATGDRGHMTF